MYDIVFNSWISTIQTFKKELTTNWPEDMKKASDAFIDAQADFARKALKTSMDFNAGFNKAMTEGLTALSATDKVDEKSSKKVKVAC